MEWCRSYFHLSLLFFDLEYVSLSSPGSHVSLCELFFCPAGFNPYLMIHQTVMKRIDAKVTPACLQITSSSASSPTYFPIPPSISSSFPLVFTIPCPHNPSNQTSPTIPPSLPLLSIPPSYSRSYLRCEGAAVWGGGAPVEVVLGHQERGAGHVQERVVDQDHLTEVKLVGEALSFGFVQNALVVVVPGEGRMGRGGRG